MLPGGKPLHVRVLLLTAVLLLLPWLAMAEGTAEQELVRADFGASCATCHGGEADYPVLGARLGYDTSGHKNNGNSYYANGGGCQKCHTNEGFIDFVETGSVDPKSFVRYPSQQGCFTCHTPHETWDFTLRTTKPVKLTSGATYDAGSGNLCANCHQVAFAPAKALVKPMAAKDVFGHWGAHHGPQADVMNGTNGYEFPGKRYSSSAHRDVVDNGCVTCHMSLPEGRYAFSPSLGGHSFNVVAEVHEVGKVNNSGCVSCHGDLGQVRGTEVFDIKADADYDRDGTVEPVQEEVQGLLDAFVNENGTGYLQRINPPMFKKDAKATFHDLGAGWANSKQGQWTEAEVGALYNFKLIVEDRSRGVHNTVYTIQLLYDSLKALDPRLDDSLRPR
jgi:hypothetical protein